MLTGGIMRMMCNRILAAYSHPRENKWVQSQVVASLHIANPVQRWGPIPSEDRKSLATGQALIRQMGRGKCNGT